ncbi:tyrosine-type recombinase/integrase [Alkalimarinus alittae]|uniref:Tyrosine-type recombinase/integrase n=1 Tax=Alkalimarinus alittae TaxID=2961619 RepID=A0ABY6N714_9ALTE|nr:integrase arm-type DNA-binding domain-containing protein [Alkalimarinus alittae]UZE97918.1 tyrosine-type recombinase/integrase [Alkalimarinus alittae]
MSRQRLPGKLTNTKIKSFKAQEKQYKISDGGGLYLIVGTNGSRYWRLKYFIDRKEKSLSIGIYPDVTLADAREKVLAAKKLVTQRIDPSVHRRREQQRRAENDFKSIAIEWWNKKSGLWTVDHAASVKRTLEKEAFPIIGDMQIDQITSQDCLSVVRHIEARDALDVAGRVKQRMGSIFRYAIYTGYVNNNPVDALKDVIKARKVKHQKALDLDLLPKFLNDVDVSERLTFVTKQAIKFLVHTFVRSGELRAAKWSEIDFIKQEWRIPAERMKMKEMHIVPLSSQALDILKELHSKTGKREYLFPGQHNPRLYMSENTVTYSIRKRLHYDATAHGFRTVASTILNENGFRYDIIERQLAHVERNSVRAAYNRAMYLKDRCEMMAWWGNHLEQLRKSY